MSDQWYDTQGGKNKGPVSTEELKELARSGHVQASDMVWKEGMAEWAPAGKYLKGLVTDTRTRSAPQLTPQGGQVTTPEAPAASSTSPKWSLRRGSHGILEKSDLVDFLTFRKMIAPLVIQVFFWIGVLVSVIGGLWIMVLSFFSVKYVSSSGMGFGEYDRGFSGWVFLQGLLILLLGPVFCRINAELFILFFRMNATLTDIKNNADRR